MTPDTSAERHPPEALFDAAYARHQAGDLAGAEALYRRFLTLRPDDPDGLHLLGMVCAQAGRPQEGAGLMAAAVAAQPDFGLAHFNLGNALRRLDRHEEAAEAYRQAVRLMPGHANALVNLGATLRRLGQAQAAVDVYRQALALRPDAPEAHFNLGCALQHLGRLEDAAQAYRRALSLNPGHADAWANLGATATALGRAGEALDAARRRAALEPASAEAARLLSTALAETGQADAAVEAARRAVGLAHQDADAHIQLGNSLLEQGSTAAALAAYRHAATLQPDGAAAWVNLAVGLQEAGQADDARAAVRQALERDPRSAAAWALHGGLKTFRANDPEIEALTRLSQAGGLSVDDQVHFTFTLGKAFMDVGDADRAFAHLDAGARLHRATQNYDVQDDVAQFAEIARALDADALGADVLARRSGHGHPSQRPVFIVGMPRSGTTLVEQILASHPQVFGAGEISLLERLLIERLGPSLSPTERARRLAHLGDADLAALGAGYADAVTRLAPEAARITDKMPANFRWAGLIRLILPNARIISCRRDPVDTGLSCYARRFSRGQAFTYDLAELGAYYRAYDRLMAHWRAILPPDRLLEVAYEDVVDDLEGQARRLVAFCDLDWDGACLDFHKTARTVRTASVNQVRQPIYRSAVARWKAYETHLGPLLEALEGRSPGE